MRVVNRLLVFLLLIAVPAFAATKKKARRPMAHIDAGPGSVIRDVSVVDVMNGTVAAHQDVILRGDRIMEVRHTAAPGKTIRYVIPGLWDMHVHLWQPQNQFPLFIANGVTGVRNMGADLARVRRWQTAVNKGEIVGPRIFTSGAAITSLPGHDDSKLPTVVVQSPAEARKAFYKFYDQEVNFISTLDMSEGSFEALAEASRHDGIPLAGHLPESVSAFVAAQDRMTSMEHLFGIAITCSSKEEVLRNRRLSAREKKDWVALEKVEQETLDTYDDSTGKLLFDAFRRFNVRQTPTLGFWRRALGVDATALEFKQVSASIRKDWKQPKPANPAMQQAEYDFAMRITGDLARAKVQILAGSDTGDPWTVPGVELHKELELLVKAGLTPAQALRAATTEPASLMRKPLELGQVKQGFAADLVVLDANPLVDIRNTRKIHSVVVRGKQLDKAQLDELNRP